MDTADCTTTFFGAEPRSWRRDIATQKVAEFERLDSPWTSHSQIARELDVPRTTLQHWRQHKAQLANTSGLHPQVVEFFESPPGLDFLHGLVAAAHLVFGQANDCGIRNLGYFFQLTRLDAFVASSYGTQQTTAEEMENLLIQFGQQEDQRLAAGMPHREITLCEDETFHPQICLVAIEPVSNFLLLEQYQPQRDADTWNRCLDQRLQSLPLSVTQVTSDQAKALITHTEIHLGAHHSPDLFHVQYETSQATSLALAAQTRQAELAVQRAQEKTQHSREELEASSQHGPQNEQHCVLDLQLRVAEAEQQRAEQRRDACRDRQERAQQARRGLSWDYHPFDLGDGRPLDANQVAARLNRHFDQLEQVAEEAQLSSRAKDKIAKARRVVEPMRATISFFWTMLAVRFWKWGLSEPVQALMRELIASFYVRRVADQVSTAEQRHRLRKLAQRIEARARSPDGVYWTLSAEVRADLENQAQQCAQIFQRSSSCVEGRNGQLSLKHHALHQLSERKLRAQTVLHNYLIRATDGTTAAERFYGQPPRDLFAWLLSHLALPARPRAGRCR